MKHPWALFAVPALCSLAACSLLFSSQDEVGETDAGDVGVPDGGASLDCDHTLDFEGSTAGFGITGGQAIDLDGDDLNEVVLMTSSNIGGGRSSGLLIHTGRCPLGIGWNYQMIWNPRVQESLEMQYEVSQLALAEARSTDPRLLLVGTIASSLAGVASYPLTRGVPSETPDFSERFPVFSDGAVCVKTGPDLSIAAGDFDDDGNLSSNDIVLSDSKQSWKFLVENGAASNAWANGCDNGVRIGSNPSQLSDPNPRLAVATIPRGPGLFDEFLDIGVEKLTWNRGGVATDLAWPPSSAALIGASLGTMRINDAHADFVVWSASVDNKIEITTVELIENGTVRSAVITEVALDQEFGTLSDVALIDNRGTDFLLVLRGSSLSYFPDTSSDTLSSIPLPFVPAVMLTVNWGSGGTRQVLLIDGDTGDYLCYEPDGSPLLAACEMTTP